jgi:hypothetical protein
LVTEWAPAPPEPEPVAGAGELLVAELVAPAPPLAELLLELLLDPHAARATIATRAVVSTLNLLSACLVTVSLLVDESDSGWGSRPSDGGLGTPQLT